MTSKNSLAVKEMKIKVTMYSALIKTRNTFPKQTAMVREKW